MADDDDTPDDRDEGAFDERQGSSFDSPSLTPQAALAELFSFVTDQAAGQALANRLPGKFASSANLLAAQSKELLAFDGMKPQGVKLLCN